MFTRLLPALGFCSALAAQTTWSVPATQADLQPTLDAAAPGDIVQLNGGQHGPIVLTKGLTIRGPGSIGNDIGLTQQPDSIVQIPAGQHALLIGIEHAGYVPPGPLATAQGTVEVQAGRLTCLDCTLLGNPAGLRALPNTAVDLHGCELTGIGTTSAGMWSTDAAIVATDCDFAGRDVVSQQLGGATIGWPSAPAAIVDGGSFQASHCHFVGGDGTHVANATPADLPASPGLVTLGGAETWLTESVGFGGSFIPAMSASGTVVTGPGGTTIEAFSPVVIARTDLVAGGGTFIPLVTGPVSIDPELLGVDPLPPEMALGQVEALSVRGSIGTPVAVFVALEPGQPTAIPPARQPIWVPAASAEVVSGVLGFAPGGSGILTTTVPVPNDPTALDRTFWFHAIGGLTLPIEVAPPFATTIR